MYELCILIGLSVCRHSALRVDAHVGGVANIISLPFLSKTIKDSREIERVMDCMEGAAGTPWIAIPTLKWSCVYCTLTA